MREIREYNMNGTIILGVDNGYGNVKTAHRVFPTGIIKCDSEPVLSKEYIEYDGSYYIIGEGHKGFVADKQEDDDTYILTLAAIAKELEARGLTETRIHLAVGLPLKWVQAQRESFKKYLTRERYVSLKYKKVDYLIEIVDCTVMPQGYAAVAENLKDFKGMNLLVDVGNGTMNVMYLNNGRPIESKSWTEKLGVNQCFIRIQNRIMDRTGTKLPDEIINDFLRYGDADVSEAYLSAMKQVAEQYVQGLFQKLRDYEYNEDLMNLYVMGGGAKMVEIFGKYNPDRTTYNHDICANAKGYEYFCYNMEKDNEVRAWEILHSKEVKEDFRSQNEFVIAAINDYYARHLALKRDPYLESREKEDTFVKGIVEAVEQKVLDNLPGLAGMYMMQQQSLLSVLGLQGMVPVQQQVPMPQMVAGMQMSGQVSAAVQESKQGQETMVGGDGCEKRDYTEEDEKKYQIEPDINEFLDFSFCGE